MSISSFKKVSAAAVAVVLGLSAASQAASYSTGFEASEGYTQTSLVGQNGWTNIAGEPATGATVVAPGLSGSGQAVQLSFPGSTTGTTYYDYYNTATNDTLNSGNTYTETTSLNTALGANTGGNGAGLEAIDNNTGEEIGGFYVSNNPANGPQDLLAYNSTLNSSQPVYGFAPAGDGATGTYTLTINTTSDTFTVSTVGSTYTGTLGAFSPNDSVSFTIAGFDNGSSGNATFDNLSYTSSTPEPASIAMVGIGGLMLLAKRPKKRLA